MILPLVKSCVESGGFCAVPETVTYSWDCETGRLGAEAFVRFHGSGEPLAEGAFITFAYDGTLEVREEIYSVTVLADKILVGFRDPRGAVNAAATLALLLRKEKLSCRRILDYPACGYRGVMLDLARGLPRVEDLKNAVESMALAKYNRLHLHLMDANGLCYASEAVPEFSCTAPPGERPANNYGQYGKAVLREIAALCAGFAIEIVPEIEIPAHARALCRTHPEFRCRVENAQDWVICPGNDEVWAFYRKLIGEVVALFPESRYVHVGGDELEFPDLPQGKQRLCHWDACPRCAALRRRENLVSRQAQFYYLIEKLRETVGSYGRKMILWSDQIDVAKEVPLSREIVMEFWRVAARGRGPREGCSMEGFLEKGFRVINAHYPNAYLDMEQYLSEEKMKSWSPLPEPGAYPGQVIGGEACAWELGNYQDYPHYGYTLLPSMALFADKLWSPGLREHDARFREALAEYLFGSAEFAEVFRCVGGLIPPRSKEKFSYETADTTGLPQLTEKLRSRCKTAAAGAYIRLLENIAGTKEG